MPLYRRMPKRGFNNLFAKSYEIVNLGRLQKAIDAIRTVVPTLEIDRYMANDLEAASSLIATGALNASVSANILPSLEI